MDSSDLEEDIEQYIDKVLNEEEQESQRGSDQESLGDFEEEQIFEEKAEEPEESEKPGEQGPELGSDQESPGELVEEQISEEEPDVAGEEETESIPQEKNLRPRERRQKGGRRIVASVAIGLIVLIGIAAGYLYLKQEKIAVSPNQGRGPGQSASVSISHEEVLVLEPFVIPAEGNKNFTYVFLSISMKLPNKEVKREVTEKERSLRGIIYDTLAREIADTKEVPPLETLKEFIIRGVNGALSSGKISEVFISKFLAV
ncbi:MAG TPA: hypothetical protein VMW89_14265 [Desulfatiglandales bacterium]|nr:hypothetical protein [Desulfatiglandales bacterium]